MESKSLRKAFRPILLIFIFVNCLLVLFHKDLTSWNMNYLVLVYGNLILFAATGLSFYLFFRSLGNENPHAFVRVLYASLLIKMGFSLVATLLYVFFAGREVSKPAILGCFVLYLLYTFTEVKVLMRLSKKSPNPKNA